MSVSVSNSSLKSIERIGKISLKINESVIEITDADDNVFEFFSIGADENNKNQALEQKLEISKYIGEINFFIANRNDFGLIMKNSFGYINAVFFVTAKNGSEILLTANLMKSYETEMLYVAASLSANGVFRYELDAKQLSVYYNNDGEFSFEKCIDDFENYFLENKLVFSEDIERFKKLSEDIREGRAEIDRELRLFDKRFGEYMWFSVKAQTIGNTVMGLMLNVAKDKDNEQMLIKKAQRDSLTKAYNKATTRSLVSEYLRSDGEKNISAFMILDVDNFKSVNDSLGHLFGDSVLLDISQDLQDLTRASDVVGRVGGDEFVIFLRGIKNKKHIEEKAKEFCSIFDLLYSGENDEKITGSVGIAISPDDGTAYDELFGKADLALYESKELGKNRYHFYEAKEENETRFSELSEIGRENVVFSADKSFSSAYEYESDAYRGSAASFDEEITDFAFDLINQTADVGKTINMLLSKLGRHFSMGRVSIAETDGNQTFRFKYQWCSRSVSQFYGREIQLDDVRYKQLISLYDHEGICAVTDLRDMNVPELLRDFSPMPAKASLNCAIYSAGDYLGFIVCDDCMGKRKWGREEIHAIKNISRIISSYLLKIRTLQDKNLMIDKFANYDKLTGLMNLEKFKETAEGFINGQANINELFLVYFDINNFKYINEKFGESFGDATLRDFGKEISAENGFSLCACRVFSDKFTALIQCGEKELTEKLGAKLKSFSAAIASKHHNCVITFSCGIYRFAEDKKDISIAIEDVTLASRSAKKISENTFSFYDDAMRNSLNKEIEMVNDAINGIINKEFVVYYQPKISLKNSRLVGGEALVRWKRADGTMIPPGDFIPCLEKNGFITVLDFYVYEEVCRFLKKRIDKNLPVVPISMNVSMLHLKETAFLERIQSLVNGYGIPARLMEFELTESVFLEDSSVAIQTMDKMRKMGFSVSIDDFGSGFSSLNLLKNMPVDLLKIDKEFFSNKNLQPNDQIIISSIINMANKLHISVICEGVETGEQVQFLKNNNCDMVQGFFYSRPVSEEKFEEFNMHPEF